MLDASIREVKNFEHVTKGGGHKISDLTSFFGSLKFNFSCVFKFFGIPLIFRSKGGIFGCVAKRGGRKILDCPYFLNLWVK